MALPRKLVQALKAGTYQPSSIGARARQAAQRITRTGTPTPPPERPTFASVKTRMKIQKHRAYNDVLGYSPRASAKAVDGSNAIDQMVDALGWSEDRMDEFASRASQAHRLLRDTGDAGELEEYLDYDFLFYH